MRIYAITPDKKKKNHLLDNKEKTIELNLNDYKTYLFTIKVYENWY